LNVAMHSWLQVWVTCGLMQRTKERVAAPDGRVIFCSRHHPPRRRPHEVSRHCQAVWCTVAQASDFWRSEGQQIGRGRGIARPSIRATLAPWIHRTLPSASALSLLGKPICGWPPARPEVVRRGPL
jgi:hypothetical protein